MKRLLALFLVFLIAFSITACTSNTTGENVSGGEPISSGEPVSDGGTEGSEATSGVSSFVIFYSYSRNTESVALRIADLVNADTYEIRTVEEYPDDPYETADVSREERNSGNLPELVDDLPDISGYDVIFIGGPIWNGYMSTPLERYLEMTDFSGKTVIPFSTSMGSGQSGYQTDFEQRVQDPAEIGEYLDIQFPGNARPDAFTDEELDEKLKDWLAPYHFERTVQLNSGYEMPVLGLGTWTLTGDTCETAVYSAIKDGYRLIDTARYYGNQREVGNAVRKAIDEGLVTREELFITTKIVPSGDRDYTSVIDECNAELGLDYIDLMLIHQSGTGEKRLYRAMEDAVDSGTVRSIGISNYYTAAEFDDITDGAEIMPAVVQNENHIFYQNTDLQEYVRQYGTFVESWYPFGGRGHTSDSFDHAVIKEIAQAHGKTSAQVILRWHLQAGYIVIPGSSNPEHIAENFDVFDFSLSDEEMKKIAALETGVRYENW